MRSALREEISPLNMKIWLFVWNIIHSVYFKLYSNTTLTPLRKALRMRGVKGLVGHKKVTQCLRSGNAAYVAHTARNVVGT
jgi:hypothetical protein